MKCAFFHAQRLPLAPWRTVDSFTQPRVAQGITWDADRKAYRRFIHFLMHAQMYLHCIIHAATRYPLVPTLSHCPHPSLPRHLHCLPSLDEGGHGGRALLSLDALPVPSAMTAVGGSGPGQGLSACRVPQGNQFNRSACIILKLDEGTQFYVCGMV